MAHWRDVLPPDRFIEVDYEALDVDPEPLTRRLVATCGLEWNDACLAPTAIGAASPRPACGRRGSRSTGPQLSGGDATSCGSASCGSYCPRPRPAGRRPVPCQAPSDCTAIAATVVHGGRCAAMNRRGSTAATMLAASPGSRPAIRSATSFPAAGEVWMP